MMSSVMVPYGLVVEVFEHASMAGESEEIQGYWFLDENDRMYCNNLRKIASEVTSLTVKTRRPIGKAIARWEKVAESNDGEPLIATVTLGFEGSEPYASLAYFVDNGLEWQYDAGDDGLRLSMDDMKLEMKERL